MKSLLLVLCFAVTSTVAMAQQGFQLAPGEVLVAIDGVPVQSGLESVTGQISSYQSSLGSYEVNRNPIAYAHAKREAEAQARSGRMGHLLGTAPGCRYSGVGMSMDGRPRHCYSNWPDSRLVARASATRGGRQYWSAHYR